MAFGGVEILEGHYDIPVHGNRLSGVWKISSPEPGNHALEFFLNIPVYKNHESDKVETVSPVKWQPP